MAQQPREQWATRTGFLLTAIGSAIGLGNIWRSPAVAYENGGGAFIPLLVVRTRQRQRLGRRVRQQLC
ncbi:hypothetical protein AQJ91_00800 [Streptomyces dysideae]|uniref:Sodium-dependent transporter n=1 Tax=Streptomyces dysideae TaxID=909626 RepID=A0A101V5P5_9ACTN|nr:hypothetical protein AQJ91_00800 [Streptomyces dysideae]